MQLEYALFNFLVEGDWPYDNSNLAAWDKNRLQLLIHVLKNDLCLPLLLAACELPEDNFGAVVHLVEFAVFRHIRCSHQHPSKLDSVFLQQAVEIRQKPGTYKPGALRTSLKATLDAHATDSIFREGMRSELVYRQKAGNTLTKYFLTTLEQFHSWYAGGATGHPTCKDKIAVYDLGQIEIEHIYPQNAVNAVPTLEPLKQRLGNLSFWGPNDNTKAANQTFAAKKTIYANSQVKLNQELSKLAQFDVPELESREGELLKRGLAIFRM